MNLVKTLAAERRQSLVRDCSASIVVFLVAMPLCMGIALASGVPPEKGLITGIIGGVLVGLLAGSPLQVSGPAAGLAVIVFEIVREQGADALGPIVLLAGILQLLAGVAQLGRWFRAVSPAVVHGMLAGIGLLICVGQFHVLFDRVPLANGIANLTAIPAAFFGIAGPGSGTAQAFGIGVLTIVVMLAWERLRPTCLRLVPGALPGVLLATLLAILLDLNVARITVPDSIIAAFEPTSPAAMLGSLSPAMLATALAIAFIASAETLLSAAAVDRMHDGVRTDYNKELRAQGIGNLVCGALGALPMTGVIVRSSANVQAGARSRLATILHGIWIALCVGSLPWLLREIPMAALAGILVVTGWRLVSLQHARHLLHRYGVLPALTWAGTVLMVVATDLLTGVLTGLALSLLELVPKLRSLKLHVHHRVLAGSVELRLAGSATLLSLPHLTRVLDGLPRDGRVQMDITQLDDLDHTSAEVLIDWIRCRRRAGTVFDLVDAAVPEPKRGRRLLLASAAQS